MDRNTILIIAGAAVVGGLVVALRRRGRHDSQDLAPGSINGELRDLEKASRRRGRGHRNSPLADGHATPAGGQGRVKTAPAYFKA
ncbi:Uncharacterised protein [Acidipropionibacterium jensenii]|uniref:Uncharacterized protein n=1 Tax=Acidipropionibacterium jensenii TaxID=1749 RepID=A0A3S4YNY5_9ACTN|nr:hypothetical protein [Acidipropionibacterium jensenii]VEI03101.1 Uncharacterised protein [Acidipropionibacterium jensenii]